MKHNELLFFDGDGELTAVVGEPKSGARRFAGRYRVLLEVPDFLLLRRQETEEGDGDGRVLMAGEIVSGSTVLEIINSIASSRWIGTLHVYGHDAHRSLGFANGVLRHAASDHPEDRLDKVLYRLGVLNPAQIESVMRDIKPDQRFGELLVERRLIERQALFDHLGQQLEQILLSAVLVTDGTYLFFIHEEADGEQPPATVHVPLQRLLLDAAERVDRFAVFRQSVPDFEMCPEALPGVEVASLTPPERLVLGHASGGKSLREIASETWLGTFATAELAHGLIQRDKIRLRPPRRDPRALAARIVGPFNRCLGEIYGAVESGGQADRVRHEVHDWAGKRPAEALVRGSLGSDGLVQEERIAAALRETCGRPQLEALQDELHELTSFALFSASLSLPRDAEQRLKRRVARQLEPGPPRL